ncbi:MAG: hypothetical protein IAG10_32940, partial [Planctomycetaceae bacterium]|nr:hypothetical protein [Planctomycetaceae bacterium]
MNERDLKTNRVELRAGCLSWRAASRTVVRVGSGLGTLFLLVTSATAQDKPNETIKIDKDKKTVTIASKIALRKLPNLSEIYPIEVIASLPAPKGQKAHETVVTFDAKPSDIHKAVESLGLKPGKPAKGEGAAAVG